ncbi:MAG: radical SAM protein [Myxococcales bacterium]|nr:radical SAM protein [Myxococcales bacterium]MCB9531585.1 radical SAM protein [Myxococcales bacterium]MCB9532764.1 radical SAM protein [Myxococcales bacterium]
MQPARNVLMILPPDFFAPEQQKRHRFPPQGPAIVAAAIAPIGFQVRIADLELDAYRQPPAGAELVGDEWALKQHAGGIARSGEIEALVDDLLGRVDLGDADIIAFSLDRHTQAAITLVLAQAAKARWKRPTIVGGISASRMQEMANEVGARGLDVVTGAESPAELRQVFEVVDDVARDRWDAGFEPLRGRARTAADEWPTPDFRGFDLDLYRKDPFTAEPHRFPRYDHGFGPRLVLPYSATFGCQFRCGFCQNGGTQTKKSVDKAVRDLATLAERHQVEDFMLFDTQINLVALELSEALREARLGIRWTDSYRVAPNKPGTLEAMAEAGCVGITVGVESVSDRVLKAMVKGHREQHATQLVEQAHGLELMLRVNLLTAFPGERREDHLHTAEWLAKYAHAIDDIAPSSFYLVGESPIAQRPEHYGIRIRGSREVDGDYKFRKFMGPMTYDEIDGLTWEEREPTLRTQEHELFEAWVSGRGARAPLRGVTSAMMFSMRARFQTKAEAYEAALAAMGHGPRPVEAAVQRGGPTDSAEPSPPPSPSRTTLGPVSVGDALEGWTVAAIDARPDAAEIELERAGGRVRLGVRPRREADRAGLFDRGGLSVWYFKTDVPASAFEGAGRRLAATLADSILGDATTTLAAWASAPLEA